MMFVESCEDPPPNYAIVRAVSEGAVYSRDRPPDVGLHARSRQPFDVLHHDKYWLKILTRAARAPSLALE